MSINPEENEIEDSVEYKNPTTCTICGYIYDCLSYFVYCPFTKEKPKERAIREGVRTLKYINESLQEVKEANLESEDIDIGGENESRNPMNCIKCEYTPDCIDHFIYCPYIEKRVIERYQSEGEETLNFIVNLRKSRQQSLVSSKTLIESKSGRKPLTEFLSNNRESSVGEDQTQKIETADLQPHVLFIYHSNDYSPPVVVIHMTSCTKYARRRADYNSKGEWGRVYPNWRAAKSVATDMGGGSYSTCDKKTNPCC